MKHFAHGMKLGIPCILLAVLPVLSQNQATQESSFEVASVKPVKLGPGFIKGPIEVTLGCHGTDSHSPGITLPMGRCISRFEPLRMVIALAYDVPPALLYPYEGKVVIGPDWINSEVFDIEAKAESPTSEAQLKLGALPRVVGSAASGAVPAEVERRVRQLLQLAPHIRLQGNHHARRVQAEVGS